jgi:hypothetical protein
MIPKLLAYQFKPFARKDLLSFDGKADPMTSKTP